MRNKQRPAARDQHNINEVPLPPAGRMSYSLEECAALTGLSITSIRRAVKAGKLVVHRLGARVIVRRFDLDSFISGLPQGFQSRSMAAE